MSAFRFIHSSDLHLGRRFSSIPQPPDGNIRGRLMEARHAALSRLAEAARGAGAGHILLAGDSFDTPTPSPSVLAHALAEMAADPALHWWLLPGNHDNLSEGEPLWASIAGHGADNIHPLLTAEPVTLAPGVTVLPAPVTFRNPGTDPSEALDAMETPPESLRIGLAHGGVVDFGEGGGHIPPDRVTRARLDYLALGDWHGQMQVSPRLWYSGSPEQDRFRHGTRGACLSVTLNGAAPPQVTPVETGAFLWRALDLDLLPRQDPEQALADLLPAERRRDTLLRVTAHGRAHLPDQTALSAALTAVAPEFAYLDMRLGDLATEYDAADLDEIDRGGALRDAADRLSMAAQDSELGADQRALAAAALNRLYGYVTEGGA